MPRIKNTNLEDTSPSAATTTRGYSYGDGWVEIGHLTTDSASLDGRRKNDFGEKRDSYTFELSSVDARNRRKG